ncbi:hypothetical protein NKH77_31855 [Streptomyces sp. M19]
MVRPRSGLRLRRTAQHRRLGARSGQVPRHAAAGEGRPRAGRRAAHLVRPHAVGPPPAAWRSTPRT